MKIIEILNSVYEGNAPKKLNYDNKTYEHISLYWKEHYDEGYETPIDFLYRNVNNAEDFLLRDYGLSLNDEIEIETKKRPIKKVKCLESGLIFDSPAKAGRFYGFEDGDMVSKVCRGVRAKAKGLTFEYID